jgi:hypothetical protein
MTVRHNPRRQNEFTSIIEHDGEWFVAYSPETPAASGQGKCPGAAHETLLRQLLSSSTIAEKTACAESPTLEAMASREHLGARGPVLFQKVR